MSSIAVCVLSESPERLAMLQNRLDATRLCQTVVSHTGFPTHSTDPTIRRMQDTRVELVIVDIESHNVGRAAAGIEMITSATDGVIVLAVGNMQDPMVIVSTMRAGAREFLDANLRVEPLSEALTRLVAARTRTRSSPRRARVITVVAAKGGCGATTVAVNVAAALQRLKGGTLLVDLAPLGHAALHLNVQPNFGVMDALQNLYRLDTALLDGLVQSCKGGLRLLSGPQQITPMQVSTGDLARLFEQLSAHYEYLVVDASARVDQTLRSLAEISNAVLLVAHADVATLWSASRLQAFLESGGQGKRVHLVLNRYRKIPGLTEADVERLTTSSLLWKVPNNYHAVAASIDKGAPLALQDNHEIAQSFRQLAELLASASLSDDSLDFKVDVAAQQERGSAARRMLVSALRPGQ